MEALDAAEDVFYEEEEEEVNCYDFEPLPTLLEDEENVSLADILSLRDSCLTEQDIWAICLECCHSLKSIAHSAIFQTLCITPDTLAFNTNGNVCFMEQLSDDPEGAFVPPEFDITGNTFEAHIYSLGATLKAAIEYIVEPETESEFGQDLHTLLEQMQEENPENRPDIESILSLCEEKMKIASSSNICRSLSAVGRRVLSIESFGASQDVCDNMWKGRMCQRSLGSKLYSNEKSNIAGDSSAVEDVMTTCHNSSSLVTMVTGRESGLKETQIDLDNDKTQHSHLATQTKKSKEEDKHAVYTDSFASVALDIKSCVIDLERDGIFKKGSLRKIKTFPKLPLEPADTNNFFTSVTKSGPLARKNNFLTQELLPLDNNNEVAFSKGNLNSFAISSPPETEPKNHQVDDRHLEAPCVCTQVSGLNLEEHVSLINGKKIGFASSDHKEDCSGATCQMLKPAGMLKGPNQSIAGAKMLDNYLALEDSSETFQGSNENYVPHFNKMDSVLTTKPRGNRHGSNLIRSPELSNGAMSANNNEDNLCGGRGSEIKSNEQWISLKLLLSSYGRPLKDYELWALCHECLRALQTCIDYPVVLCLDSVLIDYHGNILFSAPKESCDVFYLAPEIEEEDVDTEKVCIYGVAAVLWMAAKYSVPPSHKLVLPRKLKKLLLDMARKNPDERPSLAAAIKTCNHYLLEQGIDSKNILVLLSKSVFEAVKEEVLSQDHVAFEFKNEKHEIEMDSSESSLGFVPFNSESKLVAVKGPVPCQISLNCEKTRLPVAFTSPATHFKPIILQQDADITKEVHAPVSEQFKKEKRKENHMDHNSSGYVEDSQRCGIEYTDVVETAPETPKCDLQVSGHSFQLSSEEQKSVNTFTSSVALPSPSDSSHILQGKSILSEDPSSSLACPTSPNFLHINNIILKQDSEKRVLTFVPVHLAVSEQIQNKPLRSRIAYDCYHSLPVLLSSTIASYKMSMPTEDASLGNVQRHETTNTQNKFDRRSPVIQTNCQETECATSVDSIFTEQEHTPCTSVNKDNSYFFDEVLPHQNTTSDALLQKVIHLIQEEFAFDGYLENGVEVFDMSNFILNLKEIKFGVFSDRICEKFCDLYWDEKLLENLYQVVNGERSSHLCITEASDAKCGNIFQDRNKSESFLASSDQTEGKGEANLDVKPEPLINISLVEMDFDESPSGNIKKELRLQSTIPIEKEGQRLQSNSCCIGPDFAEENTRPEEEATIKIAGNSYLASPNLPDFNSCSPGWSSAFYGAECFDSEVHSYLKNLGKQKSSESQNIDAKKVELEQLLMMETKNYRKTIKFYQKLLQKERRTKGPETKSMLPKLRGQLQEMKSKVQFLELVKKYVQMMYAEQWGVESCVLPTVIHNGKTDTMDMAPVDESSLLLYYNTEKHQCNNQNGVRVLQAGTPLGLMAYLYSRNAFLEGYVQQFLYTFRYFCTQEEFLQFLLDRISSTLSSASLDPSTSLTKICNRSFYILQAWIEDCYSVDFATNTGLLCTLKEFISSKVASLNGYGERLLSLLEDASARKSGSADQCSSMDKCEEEGEEGRKTLHSLCKKLSEDVSRKNFYWKLSKGVGPIAQYQRERLHTSSPVSPKPCNLTEAKADAVEPYLLTEYSAQQLCWQLTLLQQEVFLKCHPVHFLNSRALGVKDKCVAVQKAVSTETVSLKVCNLFLSKCIQDQYLLQLLRNADSISTWVAAEIVTCHTTKRQVSLLSKFLLIAKCCYEQRNFATAMQILAGLENLIVRQLPAWKILPAKVAEIMEELKAVEVFLKSDSLCLMEGDRFKTLPTIPSAHVLAMHVQQLETGGFTMTNGAHKWTKLRNIAKVVSQVHAFQENPYTYTPDFKLQSYLRQRITRFKDADISALAADNCANFHQIPAEKHSRKIQDTLRRMKATFQ
ncbi:kinase non-catalytic C-lobe domain-containing protein 1 isoform X2 [Neopelma chrysocephalum]|uniref:kinase non-catalytic C-lobe domain-containing protein 1 isoform X2 n=1 Tax=Neopelma chrysocephalum TaxID=114329 RepID=UPI000FCD4B6C|nr:kinase non-catalytic C-lobe domain-containing protein 1 isoform X2 [Neopelma chrysocephalum]